MKDSQADNSNKEVRMDGSITIPSIAILVCISLFFLISNNIDDKFLNTLFENLTSKFGSIFLLFLFGVLVLLIYIVFSDTGKIKLGKEKPQYSFGSWISMLFCACIGSSILYWGLVEWGYYVQAPPFGIASMSDAAAEMAIPYTMFHWGISGWATYSMAAIIIGYFFFVKEIPIFRISVSCGFTNVKTESLLGKIIDIFVIIGLASGVAVSIAIGTPLIAAGLEELFQIEPSVQVNVCIVALWAVIFSISAMSGISKGVKLLSNLNIVLAIFLLVFVLVSGSPTFIINNFVNSIGVMANDFLKMSFSTEPITASGFPQLWTIFYWAWWVSYVPVMGLFIAKISYGRTIRQVAIGATMLGSLGCWLIQGVLGGYGLNLQLSGSLDVIQIMSEKGDYAAIMGILSALPFSKAVVFLFLILAFIFLVTTCDSSAYILASIAAKRITIYQDPSKRSRLLWSIVMMMWPIVLLIVGGENVVKLCSVMGAIPLLLVFSRMIWNFMKEVRTSKGVGADI